MRLKMSASVKSPEWNIENIQKVCETLKNGKATDQDEYTYELFKPNLAGKDLTRSLMMMFNTIKSELEIPDFFRKMTITNQSLQK